MRHTRPFLYVLLVLLLLPLPAAARPPALRWSPCADDRTAQCAGLGNLAVARRPATSARIGTLVVNPGGPGGSGVDFAIGAATFFSAAIRARFDIVGFDPRGVGRSRPVQCTSSLVSRAPSPLVRSAAAYLDLLAYNRRLAEDCRRRTGTAYDRVDTLSVVRDVERLRKALGEEKISIYGASYGSLLAAQYAETFPGRVRAVVLDSVMDHSAGTDTFLTDGTLAVRDGFEQFVSWCARDRRCVLHGRNVRAMWAALLARAARGDLRSPYDGAPLDVFRLLDAASGSFYDPQWYSLAYYIKEVTEATATARRAAPKQELNFPAIFCADWDLPLSGYASYARRLAALRASSPLMPVSPLALASVTSCLGDARPAVNPQRPLRPARVPTLLVGSRHDPATPYVWAQRVAAQLGPNATLLTYNGWGHVSYDRTACVTGTVDRYLIGLVRPRAGAACPGVIPDQTGVG